MQLDDFATVKTTSRASYLRAMKISLAHRYTSESIIARRRQPPAEPGARRRRKRKQSPGAAPGGGGGGATMQPDELSCSALMGCYLEAG